MRLLHDERRTCERLLPGLLARLSAVPLSTLESENSPAITIFRSCGGPNLLQPSRVGGLGANALDTARVVRALGAVAPSMTVATMMHHFTVATLLAVGEALGGDPSLDALLDHATRDRLLMASGFAEGATDQSVFRPSMTARPVEGGYLLNGVKRPCSLSRSMDLLVGSTTIPREDGSTGLGMFLLPARSPGMSVHPFWSSFALGGAESHEVRLTDVFLAAGQVVEPGPAVSGRLDHVQIASLTWFQLIVSAAYSGIAAALVEKVVERGRGCVSERADLLIHAETAALLTEGLARRMSAGKTDGSSLAAALTTRYAVRRAVASAVEQAVALLGGMAFASAPDIAYLVAASHALAFHPPSQGSAAGPLVDFYAGDPLVFG